MLDDLYLLATIARHRVSDGPESKPNRVRTELMPLLRRWGGKHLEKVILSGSYGKRTAIRNDSLWPSDVDVDLFLSLAPATPGPLTEHQVTLTQHFRKYQPRAANVSIRILVENTRVDLVAGRRLPSSTDHTLWQMRRSSWVRTNVAEQMRFVRESGRLNEILATKIWKRKQGLQFPAFCLELAVIRSTEEGKGRLSERFLRVLEWLADELPGAALRDPGNRSNVVSEVMTPEAKWRVSHAAWMSLRAASWTEVV